ncbi:MAG: hypothetical protein Kow006_24770 [Gammaproteobacteria bacterium]
MNKELTEQELLEALRYPTSVIRSEIDFSNCSNKGDFQRENEECITCYSTPECEWLIRHDPPGKGEIYDMKQLTAALQFASDYIHARLILNRHAPNDCPCDGCSWWRDSQALLERGRYAAA